MIPASLFDMSDFIVIRAALVRYVGGGNEALVASFLHFRSQAQSPLSYQREGRSWWNGTRAEIAENTGLTVDQVRRAGSSLVQKGLIHQERHQRGGIQDRSYSYTVDEKPGNTGDTPKWENDHIEVADLPLVEVAKRPLVEVAKRPLLPIYQEEEEVRRRATTRSKGPRRNYEDWIDLAERLREEEEQVKGIEQ